MTLSTALTVVSTGASVAQLFGPKGSTTLDLMRIQLQMLAEISQQITVIQRGVDQILKRLDDIEKLIGQIPDAVVSKLYRDRGFGLTALFQQHMEGYIRERDSSSISRAEEIYLPILEKEILAPIREVRSVLTLSSEPALVPAIATMLHVEMHAMIVANYEDSRILSALSAYKQWFGPLVDSNSTSSISMLINAAADRYNNLRASVGRLDFKLLCLAKKGEVRVGYNGNPQVQKWAVFAHYTVEHDIIFAVTDQQLAELAPIYRDVLDPHLTPVKIEARSRKAEFGVQAGAGVFHSQRPDLVPPGALNNLSAFAVCSVDSGKHPDAEATSASLENTSFTLVTLAGFLIAAKAAYQAVSEFERAVENA